MAEHSFKEDTALEASLKGTRAIGVGGGCGCELGWVWSWRIEDNFLICGRPNPITCNNIHPRADGKQKQKGFEETKENTALIIILPIGFYE